VANAPNRTVFGSAASNHTFGFGGTATNASRSGFGSAASNFTLSFGGAATNVPVSGFGLAPNSTFGSGPTATNTNTGGGGLFAPNSSTFHFGGTVANVTTSTVGSTPNKPSLFGATSTVTALNNSSATFGSAPLTNSAACAFGGSNGVSSSALRRRIVKARKPATVPMTIRASYAAAAAARPSGALHNSKPKDQVAMDHDLAMKLKEQEELKVSGGLSLAKSWNFAVTMLQIHSDAVHRVSRQAVTRMTMSTDGFEFGLVAKDDMMFLMERMLELQLQFLAEGKPTQIDIGFHDTTPENLASIRTEGLLTKAERDSNNVQSHYNGSVFGDGYVTSFDLCMHVLDVLIAYSKVQETYSCYFLEYIPVTSHLSTISSDLLV